MVVLQKKNAKISNMNIIQTTSIKLFNEEIPFGKNTINLPDMQFVLPIEDVEQLVDAQPNGSQLSLALRPVADRNVTLKFDDWPKKMKNKG